MTKKKTFTFPDPKKGRERKLTEEASSKKIETTKEVQNEEDVEKTAKTGRKGKWEKRTWYRRKF